MPHVTTCSKCSRLYEESSEEEANRPGRLCMECFRDAALTCPERPKAVKAALDRIERETGKRPSLAEIMAALGVPEKGVR